MRTEHRAWAVIVAVASLLASTTFTFLFLGLAAGAKRPAFRVRAGLTGLPPATRGKARAANEGGGPEEAEVGGQ